MRWAVAQTQPLRERLAEKELMESGFDVYCPRIKYRRNGRERIGSLFPGYLFIQISDQWWSARWCRGVLRLLGPDGCPPAQLDPSIIDEIRRREKNGFVILKPKPTKLQRGQRVRIIGGRFNGVIAVFEGQSRHERISVLMSLLGAERIVHLGEHDTIEPLDIALRR